MADPMRKEGRLLCQQSYLKLVLRWRWALCSSNGCLDSAISRHRSGVRNEYVFVICHHRQHRPPRRTHTHRSKRRLQEVAHRRRRPLRLRVHVLDPSKLQQTLRRRRCNDPRPARSRDQPTHDGSHLAADLGGHRVRLTQRGTPVAATDRND